MARKHNRTNLHHQKTPPLPRLMLHRMRRLRLNVMILKLFPRLPLNLFLIPFPNLKLSMNPFMNLILSPLRRSPSPPKRVSVWNPLRFGQETPYG